jgi:hypothetical protein
MNHNRREIEIDKKNPNTELITINQSLHDYYMSNFNAAI